MLEYSTSLYYLYEDCQKSNQERSMLQNKCILEDLPDMTLSIFTSYLCHSESVASASFCSLMKKK